MLHFQQKYVNIITITRGGSYGMANFTEQAIKKSFLELLNRKPVNKITVKDIAANCGINRNSFYYHFSDIPALIEVILTEEAERIMQEGTSSKSIYEHLLFAVDFAIENKTAVYHLYNSANREMFERYLQRISYKSVADYVAYACEGYNVEEEYREIIIMYYKCLLVGFVIDWLGSGMQYSLRSKLAGICDLFDGSMQNAIKRAENKSSDELK